MVRAAVLVALVSSSLLGSTAEATVVVPLSLKALANQSQAVVLGKVLDRQSNWGPAGTQIYTDTRLRVTRALKGKVTDTELMIRQLGGRIGTLNMALLGNARFKVGEEVVVFLTREGGYHYVVALAQGKYAVERLPGGGTRLTRDLRDIAFATWDARGRMRLAPRWSLDQPLTLDGLEAALKLAAAKEAR